MQKLMLDAIDAAVQQHVIKLFEVLLADCDNAEAVQHFENGIGNVLTAYEQVQQIICTKCAE